MEAHHASLGRKKLEEIRLKKAADRKGSTVSEPRNSNPHAGLQNIGSGMEESVSSITNLSIEREYQALSTYAKQLESKVAEQQEHINGFASKLEKLEIERNSFEKQLRNMEGKDLPLLKKALQDTSMEKDAAITAREDLSAQLRAVKRRLREVEEEQYKAEEDAAALRAELNFLQRQQEQQSNTITSDSVSPQHLKAMEQEMAKIKVELQEAIRSRQQEQQKLAAEKDRFSLLLVEKQQLEEQLVLASKKISEAAAEKIGDAISSTTEYQKQEKGKRDQELHDLALMVERLESGRQKLLAEIDSQSLEIERLFVENENLSAGMKDMTNVAAQWESQVHECLKQNAELRSTLDELRTEHANTGSNFFMNIEDAQSRKEIISDEPNSVSDHGTYTTENLKLKGELARTQTKAEALAAQVMQLTAELKHAIQAYNGLIWLYKPVLWNIENRLSQMKADSFVAEAVL
ncbi:uncharacterized protein LOC131074328 isoform X1 [Cryptomeria japonica]|uniref:uncharacterized protein LOC131074328 isoform X1 n=1 Tax=Cryptomeria japonica TaxID=3369 RepID=UPI0027DA1361|nr:uncharacterized protein LOC131074328 isoform X1 [Cryptomeria japonica]